MATPARAQHEAHQTQPPMAGMDHSKMAPAAPAPVRVITGPAEAALQAFHDALQVGNRDLAAQRLAPEVTVVEGADVVASREAYANRRMRSDMEFLKASKVMLLDREVDDGGDSAHIVSTSRITGRVGEKPVDIVSKEVAQLRKTPEGWQIVRLERSSEPAGDANLRMGAPAAAPMAHPKMVMSGTTPAAPTATGAKPAAAGAKPAAAAPMDHSKMAMGRAKPGTPPNKPGAKPAVPAPMDHSKMAMGGATPTAPAARPGTKPATPAPMDHSKMATGTTNPKPDAPDAMAVGEAKLPVTAAQRIMDPACPNVDSKTAPKAVYGRRVYYFCSEKDRAAFVKDPAAYLKKRPRQ